MAALVGAMGEGGRGVYMLTKGGAHAVAFLESLAAATGRPVMVAALLHNGVAPRAVFDDLDAIAAANARGHRLLGQVSCCPLTMDFTLASPYPVEGLASWSRRSASRARRSRRCSPTARFATACAPSWRRRPPFASSTASGTRSTSSRPRGRNTRARAAHHRRDRRRGGRDPLDTMLDLALAEDLKTVFTAQLLNSDEEAVGRMLNHPHSIVSLSDAGAHLTFFNDAGFGLHLLGHWARDLGAMPLAEAVRRLTSHPAQVLGLEGAADPPAMPPTCCCSIRRRSAAARSAASTTCRRRGATHHRCAGGARRLGQRPSGRRRHGLVAGAPLAGELLTRFAA